MMERLLDWMWSYDFFVSHGHADGSLTEQGFRRSRYVRSLVEQLRRLGFAVCHDETDYALGDDLTSATLRRVRASAKLLLIARPASMASGWVLKEVNVAIKARNDVVVIDINGTFRGSDAASPLRCAIGDDRLRYDETIDDPDGEPSEALIAKLAAASQRSRRDRRRQSMILGTALFLGVLALTATSLGVIASIQRALAEQRRKDALGVVESMLMDVDRSLESVPEATLVRTRLLARAGELLGTLQAGDDPLALRLMMIEHGAKAEESYTHGALNEARGEREEALAAARRLLAKNNPGARVDVVVSCVRLAQVLLNLGEVSLAADRLHEAVELVRGQPGADPSQGDYQRNLAAVLEKYGDVLLQKGDTRGAIESYREALEASKTVLSLDRNQLRDQRDHVATLGKVVNVLLTNTDYATAQPLADEAVRMSRDIIERFPNNPDALGGLASSLNHQADIKFYLGEFPQAKPLFEEMEKALRTILVRDSSNREALRNVAIALRGRSKVEKALGSVAAARDLTSEALGLRRQLVDLDGTNRLHQWDLAVELEELGDLHDELRERPAAEAAYREAVVVLRKLVASDGGENAHYRSSLATSLVRLAFSQKAQGNELGVQETYEEALQIQRSLVKADPANVMSRRGLALTLEALSDLALRQRRYKDAQSLGEEAVVIRSAVADNQSASVPLTVDLAHSLVYAAKAYWQSGVDEDAPRGTALLDKAIERLRRHKNAGRLAEDSKSATLLDDLEGERAKIRKRMQ